MCPAACGLAVGFAASLPLTDEERVARIDKLYSRYQMVALRGVPDISAAECVALASSGNVVFVDCRSDKERAVSSIPGAVSEAVFAEMLRADSQSAHPRFVVSPTVDADDAASPCSTCSSDPQLSAFADHDCRPAACHLQLRRSELHCYWFTHKPSCCCCCRLLSVVASPTTSVVAYCTIGLRSGLFVRKLRSQGVAGAVNMKGSILSWCHAGGQLVHVGQHSTNRVHVYGSTW